MGSSRAGVPQALRSASATGRIPIDARRSLPRRPVRQDVHGQGVGKALVAALIAHAETAGFRQMFAVIGDADNVGSIGLHVSLGFRQVGQLKAAGFKFGRWLDVVTMQRSLGAGDADLAA